MENLWTAVLLPARHGNAEHGLCRVARSHGRPRVAPVLCSDRTVDRADHAHLAADRTLGRRGRHGFLDPEVGRPWAGCGRCGGHRPRGPGGYGGPLGAYSADVLAA